MQHANMVYYIYKFVLFPDILIVGTPDPKNDWNRSANGSVYAEDLM